MWCVTCVLLSIFDSITYNEAEGRYDAIGQTGISNPKRWIKCGTYICTPDRHWDNALVAIRCMNPLYIYCRLISHTFWQTENTDICSCCNLIPLLFFNFPVEHISAFCLCSLPLWPLWTHLVWERSACLRPIVQNKLWIRKTSWHETEPFTINPRKCFLFIHSKLYLRSPMAHVAKLYGRLRLIRNVWEH